MRIPVFVSCPTDLDERQEQARGIILEQLKRAQLEPRALGRSDYPTELPLREVAVIARHCAGGVVLGFRQIQITAGIRKPGTPNESKISKKDGFSIPTPWNQLEAGILFSLGLPLLIFREPGVSGGVFDHGVTDVFVHPMPTAVADNAGETSESEQQLTAVFMKWQALVRNVYYT